MILNLTHKKIIAHKPYYAHSIIDRTRGMIGRNFTDFDAMIFQCCNSIHTCFMGIHLDILFVNAENRIIFLQEHVRPWCFCIRNNKAVAVIEMPGGSIVKSQSEIGDMIDLAADPTGYEKILLNKVIFEKNENIATYEKDGI